MSGERRISAHVIETKAKDCIRTQIDNFYDNGDALFREITERDYGIDAIIELFYEGKPTGKIALVQIKGTKNVITPLKKSDEISCSISSSNAEYAFQNNLPVILFYVCITKPDCFYYVKLQDKITEDYCEKIKSQEKITIRIPINNNSMEDLEALFQLIRNA